MSSVKLAYQKVPAKKEKKGNIIVIHAVVSAKEFFRDVAERPELSNFCDVFLVDLRNHGESPKTDSTTCEDMARDVLKFMEDHELSEAILLGHCIGGKVCMKVYELDPSKVTGLIFEDMGPVDMRTPIIKKCPTYDDTLQQFIFLDSLDLQTLDTPQKVEEALIEPLPGKKRLAIIDGLMANLIRNSEGGLGWRINYKSLIKDFDDYAGYIPETDSVGKPILVIYGKYSFFFREGSIEAFASTYPQFNQKTDLKALEGGHFIHLDAPERFAKTIEHWLDNLF